MYFLQRALVLYRGQTLVGKWAHTEAQAEGQAAASFLPLAPLLKLSLSAGPSYQV